MGARAVTERQTARMFVLVLFGIAAYLLYWVFQPFLSAIAWAIFLATAFYPMHARIVRAARGRAMIAAIVSTSLVASLIVLPVGFMVIKITRSVTDVLASMQIPTFPTPSSANPSAEDSTLVPGRIDPNTHPGDAGSSQKAPGASAGPATESDPRAAAMAESRPRMPVIGDIERFLSRYVDTRALDIQGSVVAALQHVGQSLAVIASNLVQNALWTLVMFAIMIFTMVYLFREGPSLLKTFKESLPLSVVDREAVFSRLHEMTHAVFYGIFMTSAVQGILGGLGWWIVGLPSALTAGTAMFLCSLLPTGTVLVWGPGAVYLLIQGHPFKAVILAVWGLAIVGTIDNVLRPYFISGRTQMHSLLVFFGVLGGLAAYGIGGLFLGPLLITVFLFLLEVIQRDMLHAGTNPDASGIAG